MNSFYDPLFLLKVLKSYFFDIDRLDNIHEDELNRFRDKQLRRVLLPDGLGEQPPTRAKPRARAPTPSPPSSIGQCAAP